MSSECVPHWTNDPESITKIKSLFLTVDNLCVMKKTVLFLDQI